jgi:hypothetical protein
MAMHAYSSTSPAHRKIESEFSIRPRGERTRRARARSKVHAEKEGFLLLVSHNNKTYKVRCSSAVAY